MATLTGTGEEAPPHIRRIVLVGAGHAHLHLLRRAADITRRGFELVVIAPEDFWYSGLATGVLAGIYPATLDRIDIAGLLAGSGARLIRQPMSGLDLAGRRVVLDDGSTVGFGSLSLNLGSEVPQIPGANERTFAAKPVARLIALQAALADDFRRRPSTPRSVAIAGGGVTGFEIAASIRELARRHAASADIIVYAGDRVLPGLSPAAGERLSGHLRRMGIDIRVGARVMRIDGGRLFLGDGSSQSFDYLVNATGLEPPRLTRAIGLPTTDDGALIVDDRLMAPGSDGVFAAGDCIAFGGRTLPRVGVYAIRQAPILFHNLMAFHDGGTLKRFSPQKRYLSIMTLGNGQGFAHRAGFWWLGRAAFLAKDWIDRRFLRAHRSGAANGGHSSLGVGMPEREARPGSARLGPTRQSGARSQ